MTNLLALFRRFAGQKPRILMLVLYFITPLAFADRLPICYQYDCKIEKNIEIPSAAWAVDTWFKDFGELAVIVPYEWWRSGYEPN